MKNQIEARDTYRDTNKWFFGHTILDQDCILGIETSYTEEKKETGFVFQSADLNEKIANRIHPINIKIPPSGVTGQRK